MATLLAAAGGLGIVFGVLSLGADPGTGFGIIVGSKLMMFLSALFD